MDLRCMERSNVRTFQRSNALPRTLALLLVSVLWLTACAGGRPAGLLRPNGVAVAPDGTLFVMDRGHYRVVHLAPDGRVLGSFGRLGSGPDQIFAGWDMSLDADGNVYICNLTRDENGMLVRDGVKVFTARGKLLREVGGQDYTFEMNSSNPYGLDTDSAGRVYIADYAGNTLRVFDPDGEMLATFFGQEGSADGEFNGVNDVSVDDQRGLVYVADNVNSRVQQFRLTVTAGGEVTLTHRLSFGTYGQEPGQFAYLQYLAVDEASGRLYVNDMGNYRIQAFDAEGRFLAEFGPPGVDKWQGMGLTVGPDGAIYIADALNNAVWVFEPDGRLRARIEAHD